jgi:hypothetical protein
MKRTNSQTIGEVLKNFFEDNPRLADKLAETRLIAYWQQAMSPAVSRYTGNLFVKNRTLHVQIKSSVLKNELMLHRSQLVDSLNKEAGRPVIDQLVFY